MNAVPRDIAKISPDGTLTVRQRRRFMINMLLRRIQPGMGSSYEFTQRRTAMNSWPDLRPALKGIKWAIVGGVATRAYMPERTTKDIDILIDVKDEEQVIKQLQQAGYQLISKLAIPGVVMHSPEGVELDVLFGDYPWLEEGFKKIKRDKAGYPVIGLPYLVLLKMLAQRAQDWADVSRMLGWASDTDLDTVREVFTRYAPEDLEDLESLIFLGKKEREVPSDKE